MSPRVSHSLAVWLVFTAIAFASGAILTMIAALIALLLMPLPRFAGA